MLKYFYKIGRKIMSDITKRAISASLKRLLLTKSLNKITIQDIADDCGINRQTFYYHFQDIYDLVEWVCYEDAKKAHENKKTNNNLRLSYYKCFTICNTYDFRKLQRINK